MVYKRPSSVRELYMNERDLITLTVTTMVEKGETDEWLAPIFNLTKEQIYKHKRTQYKKVFYNDFQETLEVAPRQYFAQQEVLGFNLFDLEEDAVKWGASETFDKYQGFVKRRVPAAKMVRIILTMAFSLLDLEEFDQVYNDSQAWAEWLYDMKVWYANSFLLTPWQGKEREVFAKPFLRSEAAKYSLRVAKTSEANDKKYMIDFVVLDSNSIPLLGVSIKSPGWSVSNEKDDASKQSSYWKAGEKREKRGHAKFKSDHNAPVIIVVSDPDTPGAKLDIIATIRAALINLEQKDLIEKVRTLQVA